MGSKRRRHPRARFARAVQQTSGAKYTAALHEVNARWDEACALKAAQPEMPLIDCVVEVCFEDPTDLRSRWGDIFNGAGKDDDDE